ncbi:TUBA1 [Symbiodinium natans]|uniref:TUBA1 protein n=1 Tax=Symbiodinium natans TaxID=878477 RepID=A0A812NAX8_9DINO|nr:TUBA1 [Symbiodinium natans]
MYLTTLRDLTLWCRTFAWRVSLVRQSAAVVLVPRMSCLVLSQSLRPRLYRKITDEFGKKTRHAVTGVPDTALEGDLAPYAACTMLSPALMEYLDLVSFYDRKALLKMAGSKVNGLGLSSPGDSACYGLVARLLSGMTGPLRLAPIINPIEGCRMPTWSTHATNLCSYPRIHFLVPALGGVVAQGMEDFSVPGQAGQEPGFEAAGAALRRGTLSCCNFNRKDAGKSIAVSMFCRGVEQSSVIAKVVEIKTDRNFQFVDWSPTGFAIWSYKDPKSEAPEVAVLENTTAASSIFSSWLTGMENLRESNGQAEQLVGDVGGEMSECMENLAAICKDYEEVGAETCDGEEEDEGEEY